MCLQGLRGCRIVVLFLSVFSTVLYPHSPQVQESFAHHRSGVVLRSLGFSIAPRQALLIPLRFRVESPCSQWIPGPCDPPTPYAPFVFLKKQQHLALFFIHLCLHPGLRLPLPNPQNNCKWQIQVCLNASKNAWKHLMECWCKILKKKKERTVLTWINKISSLLCFVGLFSPKFNTNERCTYYFPLKASAVEVMMVSLW